MQKTVGLHCVIFNLITSVVCFYLLIVMVTPLSLSSHDGCVCSFNKSGAGGIDYIIQALETFSYNRTEVNLFTSIMLIFTNSSIEDDFKAQLFISLSFFSSLKNP